VSDIEFFGAKYRLSDPEDYQWAMLEFADAATGGADAATLEGLSAIMAMLKAAIHPDDWTRFRTAARKNKARVDRDLMPVVVSAFSQEVTDRPTGRSSDSSDGPKVTPDTSAAVSSSMDEPHLRVIKRLEDEGRPDKAEMVLLAQEARSAV
jgi:hypothetical protein